MSDDWVKLYRKIRESVLRANPIMCHVFVNLLLDANWKDGKLKDGTIVRRGQVVLAQREFSKAIGLTRQQLRTTLKNLEKCEILTQESTHLGTIVTICNYNIYQDRNGDDQPTYQPTANPPLTHHQPTANPPLTHIEEGKKERKEEGKKGRSIPTAHYEDSKGNILDSGLYPPHTEVTHAFCQWLNVRCLNHGDVHQQQIPRMWQTLNRFENPLDVLSAAIEDGWKTLSNGKAETIGRKEMEF